MALVSPKQAVREKLEYVHQSEEVADRARVLSFDSAVQDGEQKRVKSRVQLQVGISEEIMLKLRRIQDIVSQKSRKSASLEETLEAMADLYIQGYLSTNSLLL